MVISSSASNGDIISAVGGTNQLATTGEPLVGAISPSPGFLGNSNLEGTANAAIVGMSGIVDVKVNDSNGPIAAGDTITASSTAGVGMKQTNAGYSLGVAKAAWAGPGQGTIQVFIDPDYTDVAALSGIGTSGFWTRTVSTLTTANVGDDITTSGNISTTGGGTVTSDGLLTSLGGINSTGGAVTLVGNAASSFTTTGGSNIDIATDTTGVVTIDSGTTGDINIGTGANSKTLNIGNSTGSTTVNLTTGSGNFNVLGNTVLTGTETVQTSNATDDKIRTSISSGGGASFTGTITNADLTAARTYTLPNSSGTLAVSASGPISLSALGDISCSTCLTTGSNLFTAAASSGSNSAISQGGTLTLAGGDGITTTNNGTGTITFARTAGGSTGDVQYWNGTSWANLSVGSAGQVLTVSGGVPSWSTPAASSFVLNATANQGLVRSGTGTIGDPYTLGVLLPTSGTTATTSSNSGLETSSDGLSLLRGCSDQTVLVWTSGSSDWSCQPYVTGGGGTITSINSQAGPAVTINNATGAGNAITIDDASTTQKGIAQFNGTNFTASSGNINLSDTGVTAASYGSASSVATFTVDAKGRLSAAANTPIAIDASQITSGTLAVNRGGTGLSTTPTNGQLLIGNGTGYTLSTLTAGTGINITNGAGSITISNTGAAASCDPTTNYACDGGNTLGASLDLGTTDANALNLITSGSTRFSVASCAR
jgi:hypothetical protein